MKKRWKLLLFGAVCMFAMAGCGAEGKEEITADAVQEYVQKAHAMLEEADSFAADFHAVADMGGGNETTTEGTVTFVKEPLQVQVQRNILFDDGVRESRSEEKAYLEEAGDEVSYYMNYDGQWTEMTLDEESALAVTQIYNTLYNMEAIFSAAENWTAEKADGDIVLTGSIPEEKFYDVESYTRWFQLAGMSGLAEVYYAGVGDVPVTVTLDSKTGEPLSYSVDLAHALETVTNNVLKELSGGASGSGIEAEKYSITSELTQLGGVEAGEIPAEAKSSAINYEKEISMLESE